MHPTKKITTLAALLALTVTTTALPAGNSSNTGSLQPRDKGPFTKWCTGCHITAVTSPYGEPEQEFRCSCSMRDSKVDPFRHDSSVPLNLFVSNNGGELVIPGKGFLGGCDGIRLDGSMLRANCLDNKDAKKPAELDLNRYIMYEEYIGDHGRVGGFNIDRKGLAATL